MTSELDKDVEAAAELLYRADPNGEATLRRVVDSINGMTGSTYAYVVQRLTDGEGSVVAVAGHGGPDPGQKLSAPPPPASGRITIPLTIDGGTIGWLIAERAALPLRREVQLELTLLAGLAARALQSHYMVEVALRRSSHEVQRQFRVLGGMAYQLNHALTDIDEALDQLEHEADLAEPHEDVVIRARRGLGTALRLISELYELGRTEAGQLVPEKEPLRLESLLRDILHEYQAVARSNGVFFNLEFGEVPAVRTDPDCVRRILDNLLTNAIRYSPSGAPITVRVLVRPGRRDRDPPSWIRVDVVDRGPGVAEGDKVFEETLGVGRTGVPGFRLGLSRRIARLLGGNLTLQTSPHEGSTFTLWLPVE